MEARSRQGRRAFVDATRFVLGVLEELTEDQWALPGIGEWSIRELAVHTVRAGSTLTTYAAAKAVGDRDAFGPVDYYMAVLADPEVHKGVSERARTQAAGIEIPIAEYARGVFAEAEQVLERTPADHLLATPVCNIRMVDYLPTRVVELVVHGIDLSVATDRIADVPPEAMELTLEVLAALTLRRQDVVDPVRLVRALTGRGTLVEGANLLG